METYYRDCEGQTWKVSAAYSPETGLPAGVELKVRELKESEAEDYREETAQALDTEVERVSIAKAFDISFEKDGTVYHAMATDVRIQIQLLDQEVSGDMEVVHLDDRAEKMDARVEGDTISFDTDSFSIYVIAKNPPTKKFVFMDGSELFNQQLLNNGQNLVRPSDPVRPGTVFSHWSLTPDGGEAVDFDSYKNVDVAKENNEDVTFYAVYKDNKITVTFFDQYGEIVEKKEIKKADGETLNTEEVTYTPAQDKKGAFIRFSYWSVSPTGTK